MPELDVNLIMRQLVNIITEQRAVRDGLRGVQTDLRSLRDEIGLLREETRITTAAVRRLDDTITMNVLDRLQALETTREENQK